jgi:hypothetical protein
MTRLPKQGVHVSLPTLLRLLLSSDAAPPAAADKSFAHGQHGDTHVLLNGARLLKILKIGEED